MKKYWKINYDSNLRQTLIYLNLPISYIDVLLDENDYSYFLESLKEYHQAFICKEKVKEKKYNKNTNGFGWLEIDDENWLKERNYKYLGEINLRKQKLEKLNEKTLENKL